MSFCGRLVELALLVGVERVAEHLQGRTEALALVVEHVDLTLVLRVPQGRPRGLRRADLVGALHVARRPVEVRHAVLHAAVLVRLVVRGVRELGIDVLVVRDVLQVERLEQLAFDHDVHHVVAGHDHVVALCPGAQLRQHLLVAREVDLFHADAGLLLEVLLDAGVDVVGPVVEGDLGRLRLIHRGKRRRVGRRAAVAGPTRAGERADRRGRQAEDQRALHELAPGDAAARRLLAQADQLVLVTARDILIVHQAPLAPVSLALRQVPSAVRALE